MIGPPYDQLTLQRLRDVAAHYGWTIRAWGTGSYRLYDGHLNVYRPGGRSGFPKRTWSMEGIDHLLHSDEKRRALKVEVRTRHDGRHP